MRQITKNTNGKGIGYHPYLDLTSNNCIFKDIVKSISNSLVLWYDIKKQQATNEGMAATPMLRDLSGNGHDATCYNFAWSGMSGIGGYFIRPFNNWIANTNVTFTVQSDYKCTIVSGSSGTQSLGIRTSYYNNFILNISISNINSSQVLIYMLQGDDVADIRCTITEEGTYTISLEYNEQAYYNQVLISGLCTVEILPEYPDALVSDGVDDYAQVASLPLLTKERGFTVLAKRKWISDINSKSQGLATKGTSAGWIDGAFYFECVEGRGSAPFNRVFDNNNGQRGVNYVSNFTENDITYLTSKEYNGSPLNNIGDAVDTDRLQLFKLALNDTTNLSSIALYSFILFDHDLTNNEIEWVKKNMIEGEGVMKYDWARSPWRAYLGTTNDRGTGTVTSYRLTINSVKNTARVFETIVSLPSMQSYRIKVSNLPEGVTLVYGGMIGGRETNLLLISKGGVYEIPPIETNSIYIGFRFDKTFENENLIIQQLLS